MKFQITTFQWYLIILKTQQNEEFHVFHQQPISKYVEINHRSFQVMNQRWSGDNLEIDMNEERYMSDLNEKKHCNLYVDIWNKYQEINSSFCWDQPSPYHSGYK
jgi:hypothetical protein